MLYVCATPIGNLADVTARVLDTLRAVELIAAEDTRHTRKLLARYDIHTPHTSLFAHNEAEKTAYVLELLGAGRDVALVTDAGMPGVSDPGVRLVAAAAAAGLPLTVLPGSSAPVTAVVASGLAADAGLSLCRLPAATRGRPAGRLERLAALRRPGRRLRDRAAPGAQPRRPRRPGARRAGRGLPRAHQDPRRGRARHARRARRQVLGRREGRDHLVIDAGQPAGAERRGAASGRGRRRLSCAWPACRAATPPPPSPSASASGATRPSAWSTRRRPAADRERARGREARAVR